MVGIFLNIVLFIYGFWLVKIVKGGFFISVINVYK